MPINQVHPFGIVQPVLGSLLSQRKIQAHTHTSMITMGTRFVMPHADCLEIEKKTLKEI